VVHAVAVTVTADAPLREGDRREWQRHPVDVARLAVRLALLAVVLAVTAAFPTALTNVSTDLVELFARIPRSLRYLLVGVAQLAILIVPVVTVVWLFTRRTRAATLLVVGAGVAGGLVMVVLTDWLNRAAPPTAIADLPSDSFVATDFPSIAYLAALVAGATAASPMMTAQWRKIAWSAVTVTAVVRVITATQAPVSILVTLVLGSAVGSAVLVAFGSPQRRPGSATLRAGLAAAGFEVDELGDEHAGRHLRAYRGTADGAPIEVIYLDQDDRDLELFSRVLRSIRVRDVDEQRMSVKPRVRAAQLALNTTMAERAGVRIPDVLCVAPTERDSAIVALSVPPGRTLSDLDGGDDISDAALDDVWRQVGRLHEARIAHRSLSRDHVVVDGDTATIGGLDTAVLASSAEARAVDRAELLVTTALLVGPDRALDAAVRNVDPHVLAETLPFVQLPALPVHARREAKKPKHFVDDLRTGLQVRLDVDAVQLAELERISVAKAVSWVGFAVLAFFLLTLASNWSEIVDAMSGIDWVWVAPIVIVTLLGTVGGAMSLSGSVTRPIALGEATTVMFGQSFLNRFTPMNAGGMAMRIRYLQKGGTDGTVATAAIGLTSAASGVVQVVFFVFFVVVASADPTGGLAVRSSGLDLSIVTVFAVAVVIAAIVLAVSPKLRNAVLGFARSTFTKVRTDFGELARRPTKLSLLFGGQALAKLSTILAFVWSCRAFDVDLAFVELGALYMVANTVASAVPTPGGVGAIEAALVFMLTSAQVDDPTAWAVVVLFRLINYWFPTIPGYLALKVSERRQLV
jgi:uncharacterized protein (TIRG00374 family)